MEGCFVCLRNSLKRGCQPRSINSGGWNVTGCLSFINMPIFQYSNEIRSAVLIICGDETHSFYFGKDAYKNIAKDSKYTENKQFLVTKGALHRLFKTCSKTSAVFRQLAMSRKKRCFHFVKSDRSKGSTNNRHQRAGRTYSEPMKTRVKPCFHRCFLCKTEGCYGSDL